MQLTHHATSHIKDRRPSIPESRRRLKILKVITTLGPLLPQSKLQLKNSHYKKDKRIEREDGKVVRWCTLYTNLKPKEGFACQFHKVGC